MNLDPQEVRTAWLDWQRHNMQEAAQIRSIFADEAVKNFQKAQQYLLRTIAEKISATYAEVYAAIGQ